MSEVRVGSSVVGPTRSLGHLHQVVLDAAVNRVVYLVVASGLGQDHRAVPGTTVVTATHDEVRLDVDDLDGLPMVNFGRHEHVIHPGSHLELARLTLDADLPMIVAGSGFPVVDVDGEDVGHIDEWWSDDSDPVKLTHAVVEQRGGLRLDHWVVVPAGHFFLDPAPMLRLSLTGTDLEALPHQPVLPGVHLSSQARIDLSQWTPNEPDEVAFRAMGPPGPS